MSDERKVKWGFWEGIFLLALIVFLAGFYAAQRNWIRTGIYLLAALPVISGLKNNRETYALMGRIKELERWSLR